MSKITFNLGLENNPYNVEQCLNILEGYGEIIGYRVVLSEYEGEPERTLVASFDSVFFPEDDLLCSVRNLARQTEQQCVAFTVDYHDNGKKIGYVIGSVEKYNMDFNSDYFVE